MIKPLLTVFAAACAAAASLSAAVPLQRLVPADAVLVVDFDNVPRVRENFANGPFARAWADEEIQRWLAPLREQGAWAEFNETARAETGFTPAEVMEWIEGSALLSIGRLDDYIAAGAEGPLPFMMLAEFGGNAGRIEEFMRKSGERRVEKGRATAESEEYAGVTVHTLLPLPSEDEDEAEDDHAQADEEYSEDEYVDEEEDDSPEMPLIWAVNDGVLILSPDKTTVLATIDAQKTGGVREPLASSARYQRLRDTANSPDVLFALRLPPLVELFQAGMEKSLAGNENPMVPTAQAIVQGVGLDVMEDLVMSWHTTEEESVARYRLNYSAPDGIFSLLQHQTPGLPRPKWIPANWQNIAVYRFDMGQLLPRLEQILNTISPPLAGMVQGMQGQVAKNTGVDIKKDLMGHFGDELVIAQHLSPSELNPAPGTTPGLEDIPQLFGIAVRDEAAIERALATLMPKPSDGASSPVRTRDYLSYKINSVTPPAAGGQQGGAKGAHYAIAGGYVFFTTGNPQPLEQALQALARGGDSYWDRKDTRERLASVPAEANAFQVQDTASMFALLVNTIENLALRQQQEAAEAAEAGEEGENEPPQRWTDPSARPSREVFARYFGDTVSYTVQDANGIEAVTRLATPKP